MRAGVDAEGIVAVVDEGCIEACDGIEGAVEKTEVDADVAPGAGTDHDAALTGVGVEELLGSGLAAALGLAEVGTHVGLVGFVSAEELGNRGRYGRQCTAIGQFVAEAEVGVGTDVHIDDDAVVLQESEAAALVLGGFAEVEMPLRRGVFLSVLDPGNLEFQIDFRFAGSDAQLFLFLIRGLTRLGFFRIHLVAGEGRHVALGTNDPLEELLGIQFFLELCEFALQSFECCIGLGNLSDECLGVRAGIHGDVEA